MGIIRIGWKIGSIILIWIGIFLLFIPVVGLIIGLPLLLLGVIIFFGMKKKHRGAEKSAISGKSCGNLFFKVKPIIKSKKYLILLILFSFAVFVLGPKVLRLFSAALLMAFFIMHANLKHAEDINSGKELKIHFSQKVGKRFFGAGVIAVIGGFLYLMLFSRISGLMWQESASLGFYVGSSIFLLVYALPGLIFMFAGFLLIKYSYRYSDSNSDKKFVVIEPGNLVISKKDVLFKNQ